MTQPPTTDHRQPQEKITIANTSPLLHRIELVDENVVSISISSIRSKSPKGRCHHRHRRHFHN